MYSKTLYKIIHVVQTQSSSSLVYLLRKPFVVERRVLRPHSGRSEVHGNMASISKEILVKGDEKTFPQKGQQLTMHYTGTLQDGTVFDSSVRKGRPFKFVIGVGQVIRGWDEGVMTMSLGEKCKLTCPSDFAYGPDGIDGVIPGGATLIFEVELLKIG